jgi:hypothetical protein
MAEGFRTLTGEIGISLEVSHHFSEIPEAERGPVALAAWVDPWPDEDQFRPNLVVEVEPLTPETATIQQLCTRTIAGQLALGRYVIGCDYVPAEDSAGRGSVRRLVSIYAALETTVVQWQQVAILGNRAVIVTMQASAANYAAGVRAIDHALRTLRVSFDDEPVQPDPELMPRFDPLLLERGEQLEDLSRIALAEGAPADGELEPIDELGGDGSGPVLIVEVHEQGAAEPVSVAVPQRMDGRPVALARLLHVAPAWMLGLSDDERSGLVDRAAFEARLRDPSAPAPAGATDGLRRVWDAHWRLVTIEGQAGNGILVAERAGTHGFRLEGDQVRLTPLGSHEVLRALLQFAGFKLG